MDNPLSKLAKATITGLAGRLGSFKAADSFYNVVTGVGTERDKSSYGGWCPDDDMTDAELEALFADHDIAQVIVTRPVEDALRDGFSIRRHGYSADEDAELTRAIMCRYTELQAGENRTMRAAFWGRLFGGGGLLIGARGAGSLITPIDDTKVTEVEFLKDVDKQQLAPFTYNADGSVRTYMFTPIVIGTASANVLPVEIHASRFIFFPGAPTTNSRRRERQGWDLSVLQRVRSALLSFDQMWGNVDAMFADASQAVFKLQGLIQALGENTGVNDVQTRLRIMDMFRSASKAVVLDAGDDTGAGKESFEVVDRGSLGGLDSVMQNYMIRLAAAARMPLTVLLGMSPAGMDATGDSDMALYYGSTVDVYRKQVLTDRLLRIVKMLAQEQGVASEDSCEWEICWPELEKPKPIDVATTENMRVQSLSTLATLQAILPEEVAMALDAAAPGLGLRLDLKPRRKALKAGLKELAAGETGLGKLEKETEITTPPEPAGQEGVAPAEKMSERKTPSKAASKQI